MASVESTGTTFGGKTLLRPETFAPALRALGKSANCFTCAVGPEPSHGCLILSRADVDALDLNSTHSLVFTGTTISSGNSPAGAYRTFTIRLLRVLNDPIRIESVGDENPGAAYLVEVTDMRHLAREFSSINKAYNLRKPHPPGVSGASRYYSTWLNGGALWTWQTMVTDIWNNHLSFLGTAPTLPYTPSGDPEDYRFIGITAWCALHQVLEHIGCTTSYDPTASANQISIVRIGTTQTNLSQRETAYSGRVMHSIEADHAVATLVPHTIRVHFHRHDEVYTGRADNWLSPEAYKVDKTTGVTGAVSGTILPLWSNFPAVYDSSGSVTNSATLDTVAGEIKDNWLASFNVTKERRVYSGVIADILPGSQVRAVEWRDVGQGWQTVVMKRPALLGECPSPLYPQPCPHCGVAHRLPPDTLHGLKVALDARTVIRWGQLDGDLASGGSATVSVFINGSDSGDNETIYDSATKIPAGMEIVAGSKVDFYWNPLDDKLVFLTASVCPTAI